MLPDLPAIKKHIDDMLLEFMRNRVQQQLGVFSQSPRHIVHEGEQMEVARADGSGEISGFTTASTEFGVPSADVPTLTIEQRLELLSKAADNMAAQISSGLFQQLDKSLADAGRTMSGDGRPFDVDAVFRGLEFIEWSFKPDGTPNEVSIVIPPALRERAREVFTLLHTDVAVQKRYEALVETKRMQWREREASRKLVG